VKDLDLQLRLPAEEPEFLDEVEELYDTLLT
jgi:hypothetical protein